MACTSERNVTRFLLRCGVSHAAKQLRYLSATRNALQETHVLCLYYTVLYYQDIGCCTFTILYCLDIGYCTFTILYYIVWILGVVP